MLSLKVTITVLTAVIVFLVFKIALMRRSAMEIKNQLDEKLSCDTNTLICISSRDSAMRSLADSLNLQLRSLRSARRHYQQGDLELKEAITNISHDLRTPLTAICGYLDLAAQETNLDIIMGYIKIIQNRAQAMKELTEELFRYSFATTAFKDAAYEKVSLNSVLEESISASYAAIKASGIHPEISMPEQPVYRSLNRGALLRIFGNIISNALKYSDGDLKIQLLANGELIFTNHAEALDETQTGKLFDRFYTVEAAAKSTGLGLNIAKVLTKQMHGHIDARYCDGCLSIHLIFEEQAGF